jgi:hypothetical protein
MNPRIISGALAITAVVNVSAGCAALALPDLNTRLLIGPDVELEGLLLRYHYLIWLMVLAMGAGFAVAARNPEQQSGLILSAALGKLCAVALWVEMMMAGMGTWMLLGGIVFDGTLGLLFLGYAATLLLGRQRGEGA